jgi:uncharacterized glyoxalase superfamily protein PhnB
MQSPPSGWPRISAALYYRDAAAAIDWLCAAFGFEVRLKVVDDDGSIRHSELVYGGGLVMVDEASKPGRPYRRSPAAIAGGNTQNLMVYVEDVDAHCVRARRAGATIVAEPETVDHGEGYWADRSYEAVDLEGHHWWFCQRVR